MELKRRVAVLGTTGIVGQRFVSLLVGHPWFDLVLLTGSEKSAGKSYYESVKWVLEKPMPRELMDYKLAPLDADAIVKESVDIAFIALPPEVAHSVEIELAKRGVIVVSNASPMRMEPDIPLLNPEVNADHVEVVEYQRTRRGWNGYIAKVPNCTTSILTLSLKPLIDEFGVKRVVVSTMQALSGAGLTGIPSVLILDNLIPYIEGEEEKVEMESIKILGELTGNGIVPSTKLAVSASCHRVMVLEGHTIATFVELEKGVSVKDVAEAMMSFRTNKIRGLGLPTAPEKPIVVKKEVDRPQPRFDRLEGNGMSIVVGRIREDKVLGGVKYVVLGHNTVRGAAGTGVLIAELLVARKLA
ncbi:MAG: aspartate-semialdehyde dehydrogenase [Desulfurococcaceae archaeon]